MDIVSAVFAESINLRAVPGPSTRIDLTGIMFSLPAPTPPPVTVQPHLIVLVRSRPTDAGQGILEVVFTQGTDAGGEEVARNVSPFNVEPGKFTYRLVRAELAFKDYGTIEANCRLLPGGAVLTVPLTLLPVV
ncbi:MAG: hypothetical protein QOG97_2257 [Acidimicrobiaceae bacterium]|jgi:hypothetical protein|nr:hypothetical protein [Acidimicrobiaceae bacterium]MDQ1442029.1 hypothetical protein [Acidimicrobiaceae bacterium]